MSVEITVEPAPTTPVITVNPAGEVTCTVTYNTQTGSVNNPGGTQGSVQVKNLTGFAGIAPGDEDDVLTVVGGAWASAAPPTGAGVTALTGDVTATGPGSVAATIANDAVTYAKMQNVSAASRLLGRQSGSAGNVQEITIGNGLTMTGTSLAVSDINANVLLGRNNSTGGQPQQITLGTGLTLSGTTLNAATGAADTQVFTTNGTWTNPSPSSNRLVDVLLIGGGGGGGSGRVAANGTSRSGGGGGEAGAIVLFRTSTNRLAASIPVTVGAGGDGGASVPFSAGSANGNDGTAGGKSKFGVVVAPGGDYGTGGSSSTGAGGSTSGNVSFFYSAVDKWIRATGGTGRSTSQGDNAPTSSIEGIPTGGGGGGGISSTDVYYNGGNGGISGDEGYGEPYISSAAPGGVYSGFNNAANNGSNGILAFMNYSGWGGGGGSANGSGGSGGLYGGGGGGGGAGLSGGFPSFDSGAGGAGASGIVVITTY